MPHRILVVDDEDSVRTLIRDYLLSKGFAVKTAADGEEAFAIVEEQSPHLVVIDFLLPKKNGFALAEQIRDFEPSADTPLIMMSGVFKNPKTAVEAREKYQVLEFLGKPLDLEHLRQLITDAVSLVPEDDDVSDFGDENAGERPMSEISSAVSAATLNESSAFIPSAGHRPFPELPEEGQIADHPVALLISAARYDRMTGMMDLTDQGTHRRVYVMGGQPVFMQSNADGENVGALLLRRGRITEPDFDRCMDYMKTKKRTLQQALLELRLATEQELATAYKLLAGQLLPMAIGMSGGHFRWRETDAFVGRVPEGSFDAAKVLFDGIKRYVHPPQILKFFAGREDAPLVKSSEFDRLLPAFRRAFSANNISSAIDGSATYRDITQARPNEAGSVVPQLFALVTSGMVQVPVIESAAMDPALRNAAVSNTGGFNLNFSDDTSGVRSSRERFGSSVINETPGTPEDQAARQRIHDAHDDFMARNFFEIFDFEVDPELEEGKTKERFFALAKEWHEDAFSGLDLGRAKPKLDEIFARVTEAYETLNDPAKRQEYMIFLDRKRKGLPTDVQQIFKAEQVFDEGLMLLKRRDLRGALRNINQAIELNAGEAIFYAYKGWITYLSDKESLDQAMNLLIRAVDLQDNLPIGYQFLAQIEVGNGNMEKAKKWFKKCLEYDPNNIEAARGLRMINSRSGKSPDGKDKGLGGVLNRFRKK